MSATDLKNLIHQLDRVAVQLLQAIRVTIATLAGRGLLALLGGLHVLTTDAARTCRWDAQRPRGVRRVCCESRALAIGRPVLTVVQSHRIGKHSTDLSLPEPAAIRILNPIQHPGMER